MSLFKPSLPPLFSSIKEDDFEMTCLLLWNGVDPNSLIPYDEFSSFLNQFGPSSNSNFFSIIESSFDSKRSKKTRNHTKHFVRPLDVALALKKGRIVSTLIACGADVSIIDTENLKPNIKNQLEVYKEESSKSDTFNLIGKIQFLKAEIESFSIETQKQLDSLRAISNFRPIEVSPILNDMRRHYSHSSKIAIMIKEIADIIFRKRKQLLKLQFNLFTEDNEMKSLMEKFIQDEESNETSDSDVLNSYSNSIESDSNATDQTNSRAELLYFNKRYSDLSDLIEYFYQDLNEFHTNSLLVVDKFLSIMIEYLNTIHDVSNGFLQKIGFSDEISALISEGNMKKAEVIQPTKDQLIKQKNIFVSLHTKLRNSLLSCLC